MLGGMGRENRVAAAQEAILDLTSPLQILDLR